ncbi:MAG: YgfZ/GcvT domain-containing protein [Opitutales bacterium]
MNTKILKISSDVLRIKGPDAYNYLQGQFSQDLNHPPGAVNYGLWLNEKGRVLAACHVLRIGTEEFLLVFAGPGEAAERQRLVMRNVIADELECEDVGGYWGELALWGDGAEIICRAMAGQVPVAGRFTESAGALVYGGGRVSTGANFRILVPVAQVADWWQRGQSAGASPAGALDLQRERILGGLAAVPEDIGPTDLPGEGGLADVAVSYTKGCYLGQEVMSRLKNVGQVRRRLHLVGGPGDPPAAQTPLYQAGRRIGEIRSAVATGEGFAALAMLTLLQLDPATGAGLAPAGPADLRIVRPVISLGQTPSS